MDDHSIPSPQSRRRNGWDAAGAVWRLRKARRHAQNLGLRWVRRMLAARYGYRRADGASVARDENDVADILIFSFSGLALSLFAIERFPSLVAAIAASA